MYRWVELFVSIRFLCRIWTLIPQSRIFSPQYGVLLRVRSKQMRLSSIVSVLLTRLPTKSFSIGADLFMQSGQEVILDVSKTVKTARMTVTDKIGVKTENPVNDFQVGDNQEFFISLDNRDLVTVNGNIFTSNLSFAKRA